MMPFCLLALKNNRINLKRNIRHRQFFMPFVALVYCIVMFIFVNKLSAKCLDLLDMVIRLLNRFGLTPVANIIQSLIDKWGIFVLLVVFNTLALMLYKILKRIVLAFFRSKKADKLVKNKLITLFYEYDERTERWYIQPQFGQARTFLKTAYIGCVILSILAILVNTMFLYIPFLTQWKHHIVLFHNEFEFGILDGIAVVVAFILFFFYLVSFIKDIRYFKRIDPPKPFDKD